MKSLTIFQTKKACWNWVSMLTQQWAAEHWAENCFGKTRVIFFRPWISTEWEMLQLHFYICLKNLSNASCLASRLPRGPLSGLCWEVQNQLLKLLFSSTLYKILPCSEFTLQSAHHVFILPSFVLSQFQDESQEILVENKWENKSSKFSWVHLNRLVWIVHVRKRY